MLKKWVAKRGFLAHETRRMDELNGLPLASFKRRALAITIDFVAVWVVRKILHLHGHHESGAVKYSFAWFMVEGVNEAEELLESALYFAVALKLGKGQTLGKWLMKIRVLSLTHHELSWFQTIERALGYGASLLEGGFGFVQYYINRNRQCVHDRIAETIVVDVEPRPVSELASEREENLASSR